MTKKKMNKAEFEEYLNNLYAEIIIDYAQAKEKFIYLTNKERGKHISQAGIINAYNAGRLGTMLRKYDPIAFDLEFNQQ